jgi:hypothetical protein
MMTMRVAGLRLLFGVGMLIALVVSIVIFLLSLIRRQRAFHPHGTVCNAEVTALDEVGGRLAGPARVRLSSSTAEENSPSQTILGMAIKLGNDQDLAVATFESFIHVGAGTANTNVADYLANQYSSVAPWRASGLGVIWLRAIPVPAADAPKTGTRVERLDADIAARRAIFVLEARDRPGPHGALRSRLVEVRLTERLPDDDPKFHISMFRTGRGIVPTGFRNGLRAIVYPVSQFARGLRGG